MEVYMHHYSVKTQILEGTKVSSEVRLRFQKYHLFLLDRTGQGQAERTRI